MEAKEITLNPDQSVISFSFAAINYTNSGKNQYAYMLDGFEKEWNYTDASRRYITYTNLNPGTYTLHIKASNNDGIWNEKGVSLKITILPPWWKTTLFILISIITCGIAISLAHYMRVKRYEKKQKELSELVEKRTREITLINDQLVQKQSLILLQADEIQETNTELTKQIKTKDRMFSIIAHDLRNPFNVVSGFAQLLLEEFRSLPPEKIEIYLHQISNSSKTGNMLLINLLQWSQTQSGNLACDLTHSNLLLATEEICNFFEGNILRKKIEMSVEIDPDLVVEVDDNMLKTILRNLISNAIKFTHEGGHIKVSAAVKGENVEVCVSDTGVGIAAEKIPLLFDIESNVSTRGTLQEAGTGLGLILCKEFVSKHHGKIWVESIVNQGSQFKFTLPLS